MTMTHPYAGTRELDALETLAITYIRSWASDTFVDLWDEAKRQAGPDGNVPSLVEMALTWARTFHQYAGA